MKKVFVPLTYAIALLSLIVVSCVSKKGLLHTDHITPVNREVTLSSVDKDEILMNRQLGDGLGILENVEVTKGTVEVELLGENNPGKSFVGFAFNIQNDSTYEAVYFRPFNFHSLEEIRRKHSMQYIFHPEYTWRKLRTEQEGKFEAEYPSSRDPDD